MSRITKIILLFAGISLASVSCRSEFGYVGGKKKQPATISAPTSDTFTISANRTVVNPRGNGDSLLELTSFCQMAGSKLVSWQLGDGIEKSGVTITHEYTQLGEYQVSATCSASGKTLRSALTINVVEPGSGNPNQGGGVDCTVKGGVGCGTNSGNGSGGGDQSYRIPGQPEWEYGY